MTTATTTLADAPRAEAARLPDHPEQPGSQAALGDHQAQLRHLRAHLLFQNQEVFEVARINWCTTITKQQSRQHITHHLHEKINRKTGPPNINAGNPNGNPRGNLSQDGQKDLRKIGWRMERREHLGAGDLFRLSWRLARRIAQARYPGLHVPDFAEPGWREAGWMGERRTIAPRENGFPLEFQVAVLRLRRLREILRQQGASPRRARNAMILEIFDCPGCHQLTPPGMAARKTGSGGAACPCGACLLQHNLTEIAVSREDGITPIGKLRQEIKQENKDPAGTLWGIA